MSNFSNTQRAYTLRLRDVEEGWTEGLWKTHEIVNRGAKAFGDWLLTLRGGLSHGLADMEVPATKKEPARKPTDEERRDRRILLALSWLSVESEKGAPKEYTLKKHEDPMGVLGAILRSRGVKDADNWLKDCSTSLSAAIRDDAVWVNRSMAFDEKAKKINKSLSREAEPLSCEEVWDVLEKFFGSKEAYFKPVDISEDDSEERKGKSDDESADSSKDDSKTEGAKNLVIAAGNWLSKRFGRGEGADFEKLTEVYSKIAKWAANPKKAGRGRTLTHLAAFLGISDPASQNINGILKLVSGPGHKSGTRKYLSDWAEGTISEVDLDKLKEEAKKDEDKCKNKIGEKGGKEWADKILESIEESLGCEGCRFTYHYRKPPTFEPASRHQQFAVMLDHAARRISATHSWIKRAEAERRKFEENSRKMAKVPGYSRQ